MSITPEAMLKAYQATLQPRTDSPGNEDCDWCYGIGHDPYGDPCIGCCKPATQLHDDRRSSFEAWVVGVEHKPFGWLDGRALARSDDQEGYADEYVHGCWVVWQMKPAQAQGETVLLPDRIFSRIDSAIQRLVSGQAPMRIPVESDDPDVVLAECHKFLSEHCRHLSERPVPAAILPELTDELRSILGTMCFQTIHYAQALRLMGHKIASKAEDEQAATIYWLLGHYLRDPGNWRANAGAELKAGAATAGEAL